MYERAVLAYEAIHRGRGKDYAGEAETLAALVRACRPDARSLLDVACGSGLHLAALQASFEDVEGVDVSPAMLALARQRLQDVPVHEGDMRTFDLGRRFDAVTCLFSSIGYARTIEDLQVAVAAMARHVEPGGVLVVEPWFGLDEWMDGHVHTDTVEEDGLHVARVSVASLADGGRTSVLDMHYLVGTSEGVEHIEERHLMGLFEPAEYAAAFEAAGCDVDRHPIGLIGRGLWVGTVSP